MSFNLFWLDFYLQEKLFGFGILNFKNSEDINRNLFSIYWNDRELLIDLFWIRILTTYVWWFDEQ